MALALQLAPLCWPRLPRSRAGDGLAHQGRDGDLSCGGNLGLRRPHNLGGGPSSCMSEDGSELAMWIGRGNSLKVSSRASGFGATAAGPLQAVAD